MNLKIYNFPYWKWFLILKVLIFDIIVVLIALIVMYFFTGLESTNLKNDYRGYFYPLNRFGYFFKNMAWHPAISEEISYRGLIWILSASNFTLSIKGRKLDYLILWSAIFIPTAFWAYNHLGFNLPIFIVGISWGLLVVKTKSLWPAIVAHMTANVTIYFALKILLIFVKI